MVLFVLPSVVENGPILYGRCMAVCIGGGETAVAVASAFLRDGLAAVMALVSATPERVVGCAAICAPCLVIPGL